METAIKKQPGAKLTLSIFKQKVYAKYGDEYTVLGEEYINNKTKIKVKHSLCGYEYDVRPDNLLSGKGCPKCAGNQKRTTKEFKELVKTTTLGKYEFIGAYINNRTKVTIRHKDCGKSFLMTPDKFISGSRCPHCRGSIGECMVRQYLSSKNIDFYEQYIFSDCSYKKPLKFDFYIPAKNICIEYNGLQHYEPIEAWGGQEELEVIRLRDNIKETFCKENNIILIKIKYIHKSGMALRQYIESILLQYDL